MGLIRAFNAHRRLVRCGPYHRRRHQLHHQPQHSHTFKEIHSKRWTKASSPSSLSLPPMQKFNLRRSYEKRRFAAVSMKLKKGKVIHIILCIKDADGLQTVSSTILDSDPTTDLANRPVNNRVFFY